jgi:hypothetical protein
LETRKRSETPYTTPTLGDNMSEEEEKIERDKIALKLLALSL